MYLRAGVLLEELGLELNDTNLKVFNSVELYVVPELIFMGKCAVVTKWYSDITINDIEIIFLLKISNLPESYQNRFPNEFYIYDYDTNKYGFFDIEMNTVYPNIIKLLIPWRR